jgi:hypothetical protein
MKPFEKTKLCLENDVARRVSILSAISGGSEFEHRKKIKYGGPLAGSLSENYKFQVILLFS